MSCPQRLNDHVIRVCMLLVALVVAATSLCAQSLDPNLPAPVRSNNVTGRIAARDLGDARLTDHYYAFTGTPGDLLITVQGQNLNGDVDVFTAGTLRPLLKLTLYAESSAPVTKGIYLRRRENLILRVEARSPNDEEGTYRLFFAGSFEPVIGGPDIAEIETPAEPAPETSAGGGKTKRVSSVGARINEPEPPPTEVAATPTPEPTPEATPETPPERKPVETPTAAEEKPAENVRPSPRNARGRRPSRRTTPRNTETARTPAEPSAVETRPETAAEPKPEPPVETGPRLVIETSDGTLINRPMSGVKRMTVERGQVVVVGTDGKIDRFLLANVVRVSIAP